MNNSNHLICNAGQVACKGSLRPLWSARSADMHPCGAAAGCDPQRGAAWSTILLALVVAGAATLAYLRPWLARTPDEQRLRARVDEYVRARTQPDWQGFYAMTDPAERARVPFDQFMAFYGRQATKLHGVTVRAVRADSAARRATTELVADVELVPDRLPPQFRRGLNVDDKTALRQKSELSLEWVWTDDDWFFHMDRVVLTGRDAQGRQAGAIETGKTDLPK